jgi:hypothetical protein
MVKEKPKIKKVIPFSIDSIEIKKDLPYFRNGTDDDKN